MKWIIGIFIVVFFSSCCLSRSCKVNRASRKIDKITSEYPELKIKDTLHVNHKVLVPEVVLDSAFLTEKRDTLFIEKEKLSVKLIREFDTIKIDASCKADTIYSTIKVPYEKFMQNYKVPLHYRLFGKLILIIVFVVIMKLLFHNFKSIH